MTSIVTMKNNIDQNFVIFSNSISCLLLKVKISLTNKTISKNFNTLGYELNAFTLNERFIIN